MPAHRLSAQLNGFAPTGSATRSSRSTLPSRMWMTRWACIAISCSCVTSTMVLPRWCSRSNSAMISLPVAVSSAPVGSSASRIDGLIHQRARHRHALPLAAGKLAGLVHSCAGPDPLRAGPALARSSRSLDGMPA